MLVVYRVTVEFIVVNERSRLLVRRRKFGCNLPAKPLELMCAASAIFTSKYRLRELYGPVNSVIFNAILPWPSSACRQISRALLSSCSIASAFFMSSSSFLPAENTLSYSTFSSKISSAWLFHRDGLPF